MTIPEELSIPKEMNMKRFLKSASLTLFTLVLASCSGSSSSLESVGNNPSTTPTQGKTNVLISYFSCTGNTERIAQLIDESIDADLHEILPEDPYTEEDLAYYTGGRADQEQADPECRPEIANAVENMSSYDYIFLGYPIWHGQAPRILSTFLESYDFSGKTIIPFCTSNSSGIGNSDDNLHALAESAVWMEGRRFDENTTGEEIKEWIMSLDITVNDFDVSHFDLESGINGKAPLVTLNDGNRIPILGLGTYSLHGETCKNSVTAALESGVRLIDTAYMYGNEVEIGEAIRESGIPREEIFVITKIYPGEQFRNPEKAIQDALDKLNIGYIDMMLLHHPGENDVQAYKAMERAQAEGKIHSLGLSNYYIEEIDDFIAQVDVKPTLVQNEIHIYYQEQDVVPYMHDLGIVMQAWYPFGGRGHTSEILNNPTIVEIAQSHGRTAAQVILRWHLQRGVVAIPGSSNPDHIQENISVFDFSLTVD